MGKYYIPPLPRTPADRVREMLDDAERMLSNLRGAGPDVLKLLHLFDRAAEALVELETAGMDMRAEHVRFETVQRQLRRQQRRFLGEAAAVFEEERAAVQPDRARWWWFLDDAVVQQRRYRLRRLLTGGLIAVVVLAAAWVIYDHCIAPPPEVRQAYRHSSTGESLADQGDWQAALAEFEAAAALTPDDPLLWTWQGVIHFQLNEVDEAQEAFDIARSLHETDLEFLLERGMAYLRVGNLEAASADTEQAISEDPELGWGYFLRANIATGRGDYTAAIADLEQAAELAQAAGDVQLEAAARTQRAFVIQLSIGGGQ